MGRPLLILLCSLLLLVGLFLVGRALFRSPAASGPASAEVSAENAATAEAKLAELSEQGREVRLNGGELTSLLRYSAGPWEWARVIDPVALLIGDTLQLSGALETDELPIEGGLEPLRTLLPDTTRFELAGTLRPYEAGRALLQIGRVEVAGMPVPAQYYPLLLERLGQPPAGVARADAVVLPLPEPVGAARVEGGELILSP